MVTAERAAGRSLRDLGRSQAGLARVRRGVSIADRKGLPAIAAEGRMTLSFLLLEQGRLGQALGTIDLALGSLDGLEAAKARTNRALILHRAGRPREALDEYAAALSVIRRAGDEYSEYVVRDNRAALFAEQGSTAEAVADLMWAREFALRQGRSVEAADTLWNLASLYAYAGDIPRGLELFDLADRELGDVDRPQRYTGRAEVLLDAGLAEEAREMARRGVAWADERGWSYAAAEARLWLALSSLAAPVPDLDEASREARAAARAFTDQGRPDWQVLAQHAELVTRLRAGARPRDLDRAVDVASLLRDRGRAAHAADLRVIAGRIAEDRGDLPRARMLLGPLAIQTSSSQIEVRSRAWYARALLQLADRDAASTASLLKAWRLNEEQAGLRGATELRAASAAHGSDIVKTAVSQAIAGGSARRAFDWAERGRAASLRRPEIQAPTDPDLAAALVRLRWSAMIDEYAHQEGSPDPTARARRRRDEAEVRRLARRAPGSGPAVAPATWSDLRRHPSHMLLLEFLQHEDALWAVRVERDSSALVQVARVSVVEEAIDSLVFALRRLLTTRPTVQRRAALVSLVEEEAGRVGRLLLDPLEARGRDDVVVSPVGPLNRMPWGALGLVSPDAPPCVAPSATSWLAARRRARPDRRRVLVVAGPDLPGAADEARRVSALHTDALCLEGRHAAADRVLSEMPHVTTLHVAAHGRLRRDNPLFSALQLADGPLTVYDIESLPSVPAEIVLSACSTGAAHPVVGDEILGLAWALLSSGARQVVAPLLPIPDVETGELMTRLHTSLSEGHDLAEAWRRTVTDTAEDDPVRLVASAFLMFGC
ncbi:MAG: CHAT domain-containing tetratricopeptide repeat protein [Candidatus Nanopelagicales bacterium]